MTGNQYYLDEIEGEIALVLDEVAEQAGYNGMDYPEQPKTETNDDAT